MSKRRKVLIVIGLLLLGISGEASAIAFMADDIVIAPGDNGP